ncbi:uncharacterized protein LOC129366316 [Poeciliopsis prolifica]|uniref:uncharacterized protein LOC129366316 n=1 Tax=Poeciliopsis prolifica TaxID=188132 RepID=UPI002412F110|nr:uncharacterized protein LOC129366316 [Poeciliopsis prolifica]
MKASHFLFTFDLPLSPHKPDKKEKNIKKEKKERGEEVVRGLQTGGETERTKEEKGKMGGREAPPLFSSISPLSLTPFLLLPLEAGTRRPVPLPRRTSSRSTFPSEGETFAFPFSSPFLMLDRCVLGSTLALIVRTGRLTDKGSLNRRRWENKQEEDPKKRKKIKMLQLVFLLRARRGLLVLTAGDGRECLYICPSVAITSI